tara:strand:- start:222 stop:662 length:441 start_codon:yes stop_codon:yes gene_type:complete
MAILTSGYGTGLTPKQKKALGFVLGPVISDSQDGSGGVGDDIESVFGGADSNNATPLSLKTTISLVGTKTSHTHVSLANGVLGQVKIIVHLTRLNSTTLVITPDNLAAGDTVESDSNHRSVTLMFDGENWQVIAGEITGSAEFVIA